MRKRHLSLALALALTLPLLLSCLSLPAHGIEVIQVNSDGDLMILNEQGEKEWVSVYDPQGNLLYQQGEDGEWEATDHPLTPAEVSVLLQSKLDDMKARYGFRFTWSGEQAVGENLRNVNSFIISIQSIPTTLLEAVGRWLNDRGKYILFVFKNYLEEDEDAVSHPGIASKRDYGACVTLYGWDASTVIHEYGHTIHYTVMESQYGANTFYNKMWTANNGGRSYGEYDPEDPFCVTDYAASNSMEDFAETFSYIIGTPGYELPIEALTLTYCHPDSIAVKKMAYLRQLLCDTLSLDPSTFASTTPSFPSDWAREGVEEYQKTFMPSSTQDVVPSAREIHLPGYQSGATRIRFTYAIYHSIVQRLSITDNMSWEKKQERWQVTSGELKKMDAENTYPFSDVEPMLEVDRFGMRGAGKIKVDNDNGRAVYVLYKNGVISGTGPDTFSPDGLITRQEAAAILYRLCKALDYDLPQGNTDFADADQIAPWAKEAVAAVTAAGIMNGVGNNNFDPTGVYSYEQSALTILRLYKLLKAAALVS